MTEKWKENGRRRNNRGRRVRREGSERDGRGGRTASKRIKSEGCRWERRLKVYV